jgi:hypothetical protein
MRPMNFFSIYLIPLAALGPGIHSASNRNEYQKQTNNPYRPPRPVTRIASLYFFLNIIMWYIGEENRDYGRRDPSR